MDQIIMMDINFQYHNETRIIHPVLLLSANDVVLVDCGYPGFLPLLEAEMKSKGVNSSSLTKVLITHHDDDHMGALFEIKEKYPEIKVVSGCTESGYISGKKKSLRLLQAEEMLHVLPEEQKPFGIQFCESLRGIKPVSVDIEVKNGEHFDWGGGCEIIDTPGHMPGHISLYLKKSNSVITGDAAVIEGNQLVIANPHYTLDLDAAKASLNNLISLDADHYYCYHGGVFENRRQ
jgi:glyoxylase-like metal-dependent hydrolase (beta-lactamase superfamily II)